MTRTNNPNLADIAERAATAVARRRKDEPEGKSSVPVSANRWCTETKREVAVQMVHDVRADLDAHAHGCSVCWANGHQDWMEHQSGPTCPTVALNDSTTEGWKAFKDSMNLPGGYLCWNCLLPTVR